MINIRKLFSLKEGTRERKIIKILVQWEASLIPGNTTPGLDPQYARALYQGIFKEQAAEGLRKKGLLPQKLPLEELSKKENEPLRRLVNTLKHEFLNYTGSPPGEWDMIHPRDYSQKTGKTLPCRLYLDGIRSPYNVGALFRNAECFGFREILLSPFCADPTHPRARRTAMGCLDRIPWRRMDYEELEGENSICFGMELGGKALNDFSFPPEGILIAGSEELGISPRGLAITRKSGGLVTIPLYGRKASLNVSVASGIIMQAWACRLHNKLPA